ncbi:hypothetical protein ACX1C1_02695 [Paenibacillus sp. strain BS8-2]
MINFELWPANIVESLSTVLGFGVFIGIVFYYYRKVKRGERPNPWKALLIACICLFSFTFNTPIGEYTGKLAILPLGVWLVYGLTRKSSWPQYRRFAWIGFWSNYVLLATGLLGHYMYDVVYPKQTIATYLANVEEARLVAIHPSAPEASLDTVQFENALQTLELQPSYDGMSLGYKANETEKEPFPYLLLGTKSRWGSGIEAEFYMQSDGKGLLMIWDNRYMYYTSQMTMLRTETGGGGK